MRLFKNRYFIVICAMLTLPLFGKSQIATNNCGFGATMTSSNSGMFMFCPGETLSLQAIPNSTANFSYRWYQQGSVTPISFAPTVTVNQAATYFVVITRTTPLCIDTVTQSVGQFVNPPPVTLNLPASITEVCQQTSAFPLSGGNGMTGSGVYFSDAFNTVISGNYVPGALPAQVDTIRYIHTYSNGCLDTASQPLVIHGVPSISLPATRPQFCEGETEEVKLSFATGASNAIAPILADTVFYAGPGVVNSSDSTFRPILAGSAGFKNITAQYKVTYSNQNSCAVLRTQSIQILNKPNVNISPSTPSYVCSDSTFTVITNPALGNGQGHIYGYGVVDTVNGLYNADSAFAKLTGSDDTLKFVYTDVNGCSNSDVVTLQIFDLPIVTFDINDTVCEDVKNRKLIEGLPKGGSYSLQNGVGGFDPLPGDFLYPIQTGSGAQVLKYGFTDVNGCFNEALDTLEIQSLPIVTLPQPIAAQYCSNSPDTIVLSMGQPTGGFYSGNGVINDTVVLPSLAVGDHEIYYSYIDSFRCVNRDTSVIRINAPPLLQFPNLSELCITDSVIDLTDPAIGVSPLVPGAIFRGEGISGTNLHLDSIPIPDSSLTTSVDSLWYIYTDPSTNCTDSVKSRILLRPIPEALIEDKSAICAGEESTISASGGLVYLWSNGDTSSTASITQDSSSLYTVTVTNVFGCADVDSVVLGLVSPSNVVAAYDSIGFLMNQTAELDPSLNDQGDLFGVKIISLPKNGDAEMLDDFTIKYVPNNDFRRPDTVGYAVCDLVCPSFCDTSFAIFNVLGDPYEFIPNGFSPDGDGLNDTWTVPGLELYPDNEVMIYNRWGDLIYKASPYQNEWAGETNVGVSLGSGTVVDGTYLYVLRIGEDEPLTGTIELKSK